MPVKDVMTKDVNVISPKARLIEAAAKMAESNIGFLPVCDGDRLVGALTDRDITVRAVARGLDAKKTPVRDVMTSEVTWCFEDEDIEHTGHLMKEKQLRRIIIVNREKKLVGVVALGDLAQQQRSESGEVLERVSGAPPNK